MRVTTLERDTLRREIAILESLKELSLLLKGGMTIVLANPPKNPNRVEGAKRANQARKARAAEQAPPSGGLFSPPAPNGPPPVPEPE